MTDENTTNEPEQTQQEPTPVKPDVITDLKIAGLDELQKSIQELKDVERALFEQQRLATIKSEEKANEKTNKIKY